MHPCHGSALVVAGRTVDRAARKVSVVPKEIGNT